MKQEKLMESKSAQEAIDTGTLDVANDEFSDYDARQYQVSSDFYGRRSKIWSKIRRGDLWIALGLYLLLSGVAFVIL